MTIKEVKAKSIMSRTNLPVSDYAANPYVGCAHACKYCYASFMKRFTNHSEPWGEFIDVKYWPKIKKLKNFVGKEVFLCSVTDPYQPLEEKYGRTRALLEELQGSGIRLSISTKSDLILRDLDLIKTFPGSCISWSINTLDEDFRKEMDLAVSIERRLAAMKQFYEAGIQSVCFISPIFPMITDVKAIIERVKNQCNMIWLENLNLRGDYKSKILDWVHANYPELDELYTYIYKKGSRKYWVDLDKEIKKYTEQQKMTYVRGNYQSRFSFGESPVVCNYFYHEEIVKSARK